MAIDTVGDIERQLAPHIQAVDVAINPDTLQQRIAAALQPFGPDGPWKYAPDAEKTRAARLVEDDHRKEAGEAAYVLERTTEEASRWLASVEAEAMEPLDPVGAWQRERRQGGALPPLEVQNLGILAELQYARFDRAYLDAMPSVVAGAYRAALAAPLRQEHANLIRWVESRHRAQWTGRDVEGNAEEALAAHELHKAIDAARRARIPDDVKTARTYIETARSLSRRAQASGIRKQVPSLWRVSRAEAR